MGRTRKGQPQAEQAERPVVITPLHVKDRSFVSEIAEGPRTKRVLAGAKAWRKLTPLQAVYAKGQLAGGSPLHDAVARFAAGQRYAGIFDLSQSGGCDSTQMQAISRSRVGSGGPAGHSQSEALRALARIEERLGARDARIIRMVCGEGHAPVEAVRAACGDDYKHTVAARFREALDALVEGFEAGR
jgi:hypothetical protein